jgi:4'-phosphopantetheinyl transferase EntD
MTVVADGLLLGRLLPPGVRSAEAFGDVLDEPLLASEEAAVSGAVEPRRREFTTVRACARAALLGLGAEAAAIVPGAGGAPRWPDGVVGSLTHCAGYRAAAVARTSLVRALGIDAEPNLPLPDGVLLTVASTPEQAALSVADHTLGVRWDRLLFSAKESVYKAWFPLTGHWLDFDQVDVRFTVDGGFTARLRTPGPRGAPTVFPGRWLSTDALLLTAVALAPDPAPDESTLSRQSPPALA